MKNRILIVAALAAFLFCAAPGCTNTGKPADPTVQLTVAEDFYATTENILADAANAGLIPDKDKPAIVAARNVARASLQTAAANVNANANASQFNAAMNQFNTVAAQLLQYRNLYVKK